MTADLRRVLRFPILTTLAFLIGVFGLLAISHSHNYGFVKGLEQCAVVGAAVAMLWIAIFGTN